jgi:hypothetical protein
LAIAFELGGFVLDYGFDGVGVALELELGGFEGLAIAFELLGEAALGLDLGFELGFFEVEFLGEEGHAVLLLLDVGAAGFEAIGFGFEGAEALAIGEVEAFEAIAAFEEFVEVLAFEEQGEALEPLLLLEEAQSGDGGGLAAIVAALGAEEIGFEGGEVLLGEAEAIAVVLDRGLGGFEGLLEVGHVALDEGFGAVDLFFLGFEARFVAIDFFGLALESFEVFGGCCGG